MTLRHMNRIQRTSGREVVKELVDAQSDEPDNSEPTESEIRKRAHEIYLSRNGAAGSAVLDWLQAETELRARGDSAERL